MQHRSDRGRTLDAAGGQGAIPAFMQALLAVDRRTARRLLVDAAPGGITISAVETMALPALERLGVAGEEGHVSLAQIYMAGRICEELMDEASDAGGERARVHPPLAIAVLEDHHALGKRLVRSALRVDGWSVLDLGQGLDVDRIVEGVSKEQVEVLLVSVLMLPAALKIKDLNAALTATGRPPTLVVGGAPFRLDPRLGRDIGVHRTGNSASDAIALVRAAMKDLS